MILSFNKKFVPLIQSGQKIHTIREDKTGRWKQGMKIHFYEGNLRNGGKPFEACKRHEADFNDGKSGLGVCTYVQYVKIALSCGKVIVCIDGEYLSDRGVAIFAQNDGLTMVEFLNWFFPDGKDNVLFMKLIHWTEGGIYNIYPKGDRLP